MYNKCRNMKIYIGIENNTELKLSLKINSFRLLKVKEKKKKK